MAVESSIGVLVALAIITLLVFAIASLRAARGYLSPAVLLQFYLYVASFITLVMLVAGLIFLLTGLFSLASPQFSYQQPIQPTPATVAANPTAAQAAQRQQAEQQRQNADRLRDDQATDLIRGGTLSVLGAVLFLVHLWIRRSTVPDADGPSFQRGYLTVCLVTFGIIGLVALPVGVYESIKFFVLPPLPTQPRVAPGGGLAMGLVLTPMWAYFLVRLIRLARQPVATPAPTDSA